MIFDAVFNDLRGIDPFVRQGWARVFLPDSHHMPEKYFRSLQIAATATNETKAFCRIVACGDETPFEISLSNQTEFIDSLLKQGGGIADSDEYLIASEKALWGIWSDGNNAAILACEMTFYKAFILAFGGADALNENCDRYLATFGYTLNAEFVSFIRNFPRLNKWDQTLEVN